MEADTLAKLLDLPSTDARVEDALRAYVMRRPELRIDPADADGNLDENVVGSPT